MDAEISIRYEGGDAEGHVVDLFQLGVSLQGFARIFAVCGNFVETGKYNKQFETLAVNVSAKETIERNCYEVLTTIQGIAESKELWTGTGGVILGLLIQHVLGLRKEAEMKLQYMLY